MGGDITTYIQSTALGFFPRLLSEEGWRHDSYPIQCIPGMYSDPLACNVKAVSFVHLFASFAIECNLFEADQRGGLLIRDSNEVCNILSDLVSSSDGSHNEDHQQLVDTTFLASLVRLRQSDLFKKEDIQRYNLLHDLCGQTSYFAEQRFRYLTDMNPTALISIENDSGYLPLHYAAADFGSIDRFRQVFDTGMRYLLHRLNWRVGKVTREETKLWMP